MAVKSGPIVLRIGKRGQSDGHRGQAGGICEGLLEGSAVLLMLDFVEVEKFLGRAVAHPRLFRNIITRFGHSGRDGTDIFFGR